VILTLEELKKKVEAILFSAGRKLEFEEIRRLCRAKEEDLKQVLEELKKEIDEKDSSIMLVEEGNGWKLTIREKYLNVVRRIVTQTELTKSIMETLAVIAWKYPVVQSEVIKIRTNKAYDHLSELEELGYITRQKYGRTKLVKLTQKFFDYFDLPPDKVKEVFKDFNQIAEAIQQKEEEIKKKKEELEKMKESKENQKIEKQKAADETTKEATGQTGEDEVEEESKEQPKQEVLAPKTEHTPLEQETSKQEQIQPTKVTPELTTENVESAEKSPERATHEPDKKLDQESEKQVSEEKVKVIEPPEVDLVDKEGHKQKLEVYDEQEEEKQKVKVVGQKKLGELEVVDEIPEKQELKETIEEKQPKESEEVDEEVEKRVEALLHPKESKKGSEDKTNK